MQEAWQSTEEQQAPVTHHSNIDAALAYFCNGLERMAGLMHSWCEAQQGIMGNPSSAAEVAEKMHQAFEHSTSALLVSKPLNMGPLKMLLDDNTVNDILVNHANEIYVERAGQMQRVDLAFESEEHLLEIAQSIAMAVGRRLDMKRPLLDARLADGSRVNIIAPPLAVDGISMSIRKFSKNRITLETMTKSGCMSEQLAGFLSVAAKSKINIIISGGTGSGKTTLLNAVSQHINPHERIVTIEDSAELQLQLPHVVRLETKEPESRNDRSDEVSIRDLVKNSLRMRPDRIIVGEVRGPEAFDMIQAMNTGHDGSLTTIHANTPRDGLARIENMVSMANLNIPTASVRKQIASAIQLIVQTARMEDGVRRVQLVSEVVGMEGDVLTMQDIFKFTANGLDADGKLKGTHKWSGVFPRHFGFSQALRDAGVFSLGA